MQDTLKSLRQSFQGSNKINCAAAVTEGITMSSNANTKSIENFPNMNTDLTKHLNAQLIQACSSTNTIKSTIVNEKNNKKERHLATCSSFHMNEKTKEEKPEKKRNKQVINIKQVYYDANLMNDDFSNQNTTNNASTSKQTPSASCFNIFNNKCNQTDQINTNKKIIQDKNHKPILTLDKDQVNSYASHLTITKSNCDAIKSTIKDKDVKDISLKAPELSSVSQVISKKLNNLISKGVESRKIFPLKKIK